MALCRSSSPLTEKGEQGARATCRIDPKDGSWYASMTRAESFMMASTVWTTLSGGRPPSLRERSMLPREANIRIPSSSAAANWVPIRSPHPAGKT